MPCCHSRSCRIDRQLCQPQVDQDPCLCVCAHTCCTGTLLRKAQLLLQLVGQAGSIWEVAKGRLALLHASLNAHDCAKPPFGCRALLPNRCALCALHSRPACSLTCSSRGGRRDRRQAQRSALTYCLGQKQRVLSLQCCRGLCICVMAGAQVLLVPYIVLPPLPCSWLA